MWPWLERTFGEGFMPHGHCYLWTPSMVWLQVSSNALIGLAYLAISLMLYRLVRRTAGVPFSWMYIAFGVFILACGFTHALDVVTVWHPVYWADGAVRAITAVASAGTAVLLFPLLPKASALAQAAKLAHERGEKLEAAFEELNLAHAETKRMEAMISTEIVEQTRELAAEILRLRAERDALQRRLG